MDGEEGGEHQSWAPKGAGRLPRTSRRPGRAGPGRVGVGRALTNPVLLPLGRDPAGHGGALGRGGGGCGGYSSRGAGRRRAALLHSPGCAAMFRQTWPEPASRLPASPPAPHRSAPAPAPARGHLLGRAAAPLCAPLPAPPRPLPPAAPSARRGRLRAPGAWLSLPLPGSALSRRAGLRLRLAHLPGAPSQCRLGEESRAEEIQTLRLKGEVLRETSPFQQTSIRTEKGPGTATSFSFPVVFGQRAQRRACSFEPPALGSCGHPLEVASRSSLFPGKTSRMEIGSESGVEWGACCLPRRVKPR
ncbi:uncharacterized protein [Equus asinus]|uniref:uncharacterized protein n=1 Tax=Equus asinus TaxID=9793 RepID=UPI0038F64D75